MSEKIYNCDIGVLTKAVATKGQQLLSIDRKMLSIKHQIFDMSKIYIFSFSRSELDKLNYEYVFYLYEYVSTFDMERFRKYFYFEYKKSSDIVKKLESIVSYEDFESELKKKTGSEEIFSNQKEFESFREFVRELAEKSDDPYAISELILVKAVALRLSQVQFHTGSYEEKLVLLKKKSQEKIDKTMGTRYLHLKLYGEEHDPIDL